MHNQHQISINHAKFHFSKLKTPLMVDINAFINYFMQKLIKTKNVGDEFLKLDCANM